MPVRVWLPPLLRDREDAEEIIGTGATLRELLTGLGEAGARVMNASADQAAPVAVYLNGAPTADWQLSLRDGDEVVLVHPIRGGR